MRPLSIAAGPLVTARMDSLIGIYGRTQLTAGREVELIGTDNVNALDPEYNAAESPSGSTRILDHSFLPLVPIEHPKAKPMLSNKAIRDGDYADASTQTYGPVHPEPWYPSVIYHFNFTRGEPYFQCINFNDEATGTPSLMLNWEMFRSLWKLASTTRELQGKQQWHNSERHRYSIFYEDLYQNSQKELQAISNLQALGYMRPDLRPELVLQGKQHQANIDGNNATGLRSQLEEQRVIESYGGKLEDVREAQNALQPFLDELFGTLVVLPNVNDLATPLEVPVIETDTSLDDVLFVGWPENNWNDDCNHPGWGEEGPEPKQHHDLDAAWNDAWQEHSREDIVQQLSLELEEKRQYALDAQADFDNFRGSHDTEFYQYIGRTSDAQAVAEKNFGPVWFKMSVCNKASTRDRRGILQHRRETTTCATVFRHVAMLSL